MRIKEISSLWRKDASINNLYVVAVNTGLRSGELRALTLDDIDFENNTINCY